MEGLLVPVVRLIVVLTVGITQRSVGVDLEVGTDEFLTIRNGVNLITQTAVLLVEEVVVGVGVGLCHGVTAIEVLVVHELIISLIVLGRIRNYIVIGNQAGVGTPTGVETHGSFTGLAFLGGDDNNTIGAAVTVNGGSSGILQDRHGLNVARVDVGDFSFIGNAIYNDERAGACIHGTDTTDADDGTATIICTPGVVPARAEVTLEDSFLEMVSLSTTAAEPVKELLVAVP